jgi:uroporphyrinogen-III synthase
MVTRPQEQAANLIGEIEKRGGVVVHAPMIVIQAIAKATATRALNALDSYHAVIFISRNAAEHGLHRIAEARKTLRTQAVFAVGVGTAARLRELGVRTVLTPRSEFSSEGLLKMPGLSAAEITGKRVLIIRGVGGRELLSQTLQSRGADVDYCEVYERVVPSTRLADVLEKRGVTAPDIAIITSPEALTNLAEKIDQEGLDLMYDVPLMVAGERTAQEVERLGFTLEPVMVDNPGDQRIIEALVRWACDEQ